ncbi:LysR family transcriptional regulator [Sedimentibacter sp. MB31-C6]|uniref:LysR family transcriptional regulator n=1 Tax=Sedimentibacter sp. MB31-C6 TaxID=3109366 RepID=UPI002DDCCCF8|nr:LysR family transcriptional regulator [Sedimentibacter sp. MB36-C1]WSI04040.1 LysR family transcriptional regulator [Sedimentibacter sp. MB36-C1]
MIDFRHKTFLELCKVRNYTKTAENLHMTQPAVTQHIKYLEQIYGGKLFIYSGKNLTITSKGKKLYEYTQRMIADSKKIEEMVISHNENITISFGATLTIGEFVMPSIISRVMKEKKNLHFNMFVENTKSLLLKLQSGEISFALLEGFFDKSKYGYKLFRKEQFISVCSSKSPLKNGKYALEELLNERLILREKGSGTRDILEQILHEVNLSKDNFKSIIEIGNMSAIKELVAQDLGITFMYKAAAQKDLVNSELYKINLDNFEVNREFNFVYLKDSVHENIYLKWFDLLSK